MQERVAAGRRFLQQFAPEAKAGAIPVQISEEDNLAVQRGHVLASAQWVYMEREGDKVRSLRVREERQGLGTMLLKKGDDMYIKEGQPVKLAVCVK